MNAYGASAEETVRTRRFLKEWADEGVLSREQYERMERDAPSEVRTTNGPLGVVLFFFTFVIVGAGIGLFFQLFLHGASTFAEGFCLIFFAAVCYGAAEQAVSQKRLYRFGIVEALLLCAIGLLWWGMVSVIGGPEHRSLATITAVVSIFSLWIWRRFGLALAFVAAMGFVILLPPQWTASSSIQHVIVALFYLAGLAVVLAARAPHRFNYLNDGYSFAEGLLWLGIYLALNLQLFAPGLLTGYPSFTEFPRPFYWTTWILIWILPPIVLTRGIRRKDRLVMAVGGVTALLTLVTNKPYLGWPRHTWDPMILGAVLVGVALGLRRWLAQGPDGVRHGFTAGSLTARHKRLMGAGAMVFSSLTPQPAPQQADSGVQFGGGDSGGGGATSNF